MNEVEQAGLSARIGILEEMMAMLIASLLSASSERGPEAIEEFRATMWGVMPKNAQDLPEDDPRMKAYRASWEERLDALLDRAAALAEAQARSQSS